MAIFGRASLTFAVIMAVLVAVLAVWVSIDVRDQVVALSANRSRDFVSPVPRIWMALFAALGAGFFFGIATTAAFTRRSEPKDS
jgi:hypothetical protein